VAGVSDTRIRRKIKFHCPEIVQDLRHQPLFIIVAFWGMRTDTLLTKEQISRTFHISQKMAEAALHYIRHEGKSHISCRCYMQNTRVTGRRCALRILDVQLSPEIAERLKRMPDFYCKPAVSALIRCGKPRTKFELLRQWMIFRKCGEVVPPELLSEK
jgi:hypothetical protein